MTDNTVTVSVRLTLRIGQSVAVRVINELNREKWEAMDKHARGEYAHDALAHHVGIEWEEID